MTKVLMLDESGTINTEDEKKIVFWMGYFMILKIMM
jgi:hypothetical protein